MPALLGKVPRTRQGQRFWKEIFDVGKNIVDTGFNVDIADIILDPGRFFKESCGITPPQWLSEILLLVNIDSRERMEICRVIRKAYKSPPVSFST